MNWEVDRSDHDDAATNCCNATRRPAQIGNGLAQETCTERIRTSSSSVSIAAGHEVAVKVFKGEASPDGRAADEIDVTCAVAHPNLIRVIGLVQQPHALVVHKAR